MKKMQELVDLVRRAERRAEGMKKMQELVDLVRRAERRAEALTIVSFSLEGLMICDAEGKAVRTAMLGATEALVEALADVVKMAEAELDNGLEGHCPD